MQTGPADRGGVSRLAVPVVWLLATVFLGLESVARCLGRFLDNYTRGAEALGRIVADAGKALHRGCLRLGRFLMRVLGPVGSLLRRVLSPVIRLLRRPVVALLHALRRCWDWLNLWIFRRMFAPLGRLVMWAARRFPRLIQALRRGLFRVSVMLEPVLRWLDAVTAAADRAATRLKVRLRWAWQPVVDAVNQWRTRAQRG